MADPLIVNLRPNEGDVDVNALTPFRFGVRDLDTRADLTSIYTSVLYGKAIYDPANGSIPSNDDVLEAADLSVYFSTFNDAAGTTEPKNPCDRTIATVMGTDVFRIEKSDLDGVPQEGVLFMTVDAQESADPCGLRATLDLVSVNTDTFSYVDFAGFTGVMLGLVYWPENTGVFAFFVDDGTKKIVVAGPSEDGSGTRSTAVTAVFDWSAEAYTYTLVLDPSPFTRKATLLATNSLGVEERLAELDVDTLPSFLTSVRMGNLLAEDSPTGLMTVFLGGDFPDMGDYIDIYGFTVLDFGKVLLTGGSPTASSTREVEPSELIFVDGPGGVDEWSTEGAGEVEQTDTATVLTSSSGGDYLYRDEPDLSTGEWVVMGKLAGADSEHLGVYTTGMGLVVEDGTRAFRLTFLDDFVDYKVGVEESAATDDPVVVGYKLPADDVDWSTAFRFTMLGSLSRDVLRVYFDSDTSIGIDHTYTAAGYPVSTESRVSFGFFDSSSTFSGSLYLVNLWVLQNCTLYEPVDGNYPETEGWTRTSSGGSRSLSGDDLLIECDSPGYYDIYSITDATYDETSGAAVVFRAELGAWVDSAGASSPLRTEFGPVAAVRVSNTAAQVFFTKNSDGKTYVYLSGGSTDLANVLSQNEAGRAISYEIDTSASHVFLLDVKPLQYVRLYMDLEVTPVIEVEWRSVSSVLRALPPNMPVDAVVAVGSLGEDAGVAATFSFFRASIGRGYDLRVALSVSEADLQESVYGASASLMIDLQDED